MLFNESLVTLLSPPSPFAFNVFSHKKVGFLMSDMRRWINNIMGLLLRGECC